MNLCILLIYSCLESKDERKNLVMLAQLRYILFAFSQGAKLFLLSGMRNGEYPHQDMYNLSRFISIIKPKQVLWRSSHPYVVADRVEDVTDPESLQINPKEDRTVCLYGYVRGTHFRNNRGIHIPGKFIFVSNLGLWKWIYKQITGIHFSQYCTGKSSLNFHQIHCYQIEYTWKFLYSTLSVKLMELLQILVWRLTYILILSVILPVKVICIVLYIYA